MLSLESAGTLSAVAIPGDVNADSTVDVYDILILARAYGSTPKSSNWNPKADINSDGVVDVYDVLAAAGHYGENVTYDEDSSIQIMRYAIGTYSWTPQDYATRSDGAQMHFDYPSSTLRQINVQRTNFTRFLYRNIREIYWSATEYNAFVSNGWLLKNASNSYVKFRSNYCVDIGNISYQQWVADWCYSHLQPEFDAVFLDNGLYATADSWSYGASSEPINPRSGKPFTDSEVVNAYIGIYRTIKAKVGNRVLVVANGIYTGARWMHWGVKDNYIKLVNELDGFMTEGWLSKWEANGVNYYDETYIQDRAYNWKDSIDMLVEINRLFSGKNIIVTAHNSDNQYEWAPRFDSPITTTEEKEQYCLFNYASLLLTISSKNTNWLALGWWGLTNMKSLFSLDIGKPKADYYQNTAGVYVREFTKGTVYVNPSSVDRDGMKPHSARIVLSG
jgi:hypothetical protein